MAKPIPILINLFLAILMVSAQKPLNEDINYLMDHYGSYFSVPRKGIYLHLNKTTFIAGEDIGYSIYVYDKKDKNFPLEESYVYVDLIDSQGQVLSSKTVLYSKFRGFNDISLNPELPSGDYFLQAYTNGMEELIEDDSSVYKIKILNFDEQYDTEVTDNGILEPSHIKIISESGEFLLHKFNTFAIQITDLFDNPVVPDKVVLMDSNNGDISQIKVNEIGLGRFSLVPLSDETYHIEVSFGDSKIIEKLPSAKTNGFQIAVDSDYQKEKLLVSINRNDTSSSENLSLMVHQDGKLLAFPISLDMNEDTKEVILPFTSVFEGVNTLTLLKARSTVAERLVYVQHKKTTSSSKLLQVKKQNDSLTVYLKNSSVEKSSNYNILSVSVLPDMSISYTDFQSFSSSHYLQGNISDFKISEFQNWKMDKHKDVLFTLDNLLILEGRGRYEWKNILNDNLIKPRISSGLSTIDGYVNLFNAKNDSLTVMLYSKENGLFETTLLGGNEKFQFKDLKLANDSKFSLSILNRKGKPIYANFFFTIIPEKAKFRHAYKPKTHTIEEKKSIPTERISFFKDVEQLEEVIVSASKLKRERIFGNFYGQKIDSTLLSMGTLENYIRSFGFSTTFVDPLHPDARIAGTTQFVKYCRGNAILSPMIVLDGIFDRYAMTYSNVAMEYIDEVYYKSSEHCAPALFVVFTNDKYKNREKVEALKSSKEFVVQYGYNVSSPFIRPEYISKSNRSFEQYGIISWKPNLASNDKGVISFKIPDDGQRKLKLNLQGFSENGAIISDELIVNISDSY